MYGSEVVTRFRPPTHRRGSQREKSAWLDTALPSLTHTRIDGNASYAVHTQHRELIRARLYVKIVSGWEDRGRNSA